MATQLPDGELHLCLIKLDAELSALGLPLRFRVMRCFNSLYGSVPDGELREKLFEPITSWYLDKYGEQAQWDGVIGRIPVLLRGAVYLVRVPFVLTDTVIRFTDRFEGLPQEIASTFSPEEFDLLGRQVAGSTLSFQKLYALSADDLFLDEVERDLVWMALFDLETAATSLRNVGDTRNSIFHIHAAAEKFLKVALRRAGNSTKLQALGHNLPRIFAKLVKAEVRYAWLESSVDLLHKLVPDMEIRYRMLPRTVANAISAFNAALSVCGTLAQIWIFDIERGTKNSCFTPGRFYMDWNKRTFYCDRILNSPGAKERAVMIFFNIDSFAGHGIIAEQTIGLDQSALFLEVTDDATLRTVSHRYEYQMQNRGKSVKPEDLGIKIASGPEGSYITGSFKIKNPDR
jgi:HEPN domain-containing protein